MLSIPHAHTGFFKTDKDTEQARREASKHGATLIWHEDFGIRLEFRAPYANTPDTRRWIRELTSANEAPVFLYVNRVSDLLGMTREAHVFHDGCVTGVFEEEFEQALTEKGFTGD